LRDLLKYYGIDEELLSPLVPTFGEQGRLSSAAATELKLKAGIPVSYRAGDQPNNAFSLNVSQPEKLLQQPVHPELYMVLLINRIMIRYQE
jgi:xylulokinase